MGKRTSRGKSNEARPPAAEDRTQQLQVIGENTQPDGAEHTPGEVTEVVAEGATNEPGVTQETVPMPAAVWPPRTQKESPNRPPPLRGAPPEVDTGSHMVPTQKPGLLTTELRRALPPWALPLLTSQPVSVWLGARIALTLLALLAGVMLPGTEPRGTANWYGAPGGPPLTGLVDRIAGVWTRWDGQWYLKIATEGYHRDDGSAAFFPLYPTILQVTGWLAGERYIWAGILLSSLFFLGALVLLHRLVRLDFHPEDAGRTVLYLAAFPVAFFFFAIYSESLFLFLSVAALLAARTQRWWLSALAVSFAIWTRTTGLLLLLPLGWELWRAYHPPMPKGANEMPPPRPHRLSLASLSLPVISLLIFLGWSWAVLGHPLAPLAAQTEWNRNFRLPWESVVQGFQQAMAMPFQFQPENQSWTYLASLLFALVMGVLSIRWLRGSYSLYLWAGILFPLFSGTRLNPLLSYPRFVLVLFPAFIVLALLGRNRYAHQVILWVSFLLLGLFTIRFANWFWVA